MGTQKTAPKEPIPSKNVQNASENHASKTMAFQDNRPETALQLKLQGMADASTVKGAVLQQKANTTGLPDTLKSGIEHLSGHTMDDVKVHYNSDKPAQLNAHAYAQGSQIHLASGQEKHLPHEAWHVVQQKQGRVQPTTQLKEKVNINDDEGLEKEADVMGAKAIEQSTVQKKSTSLKSGIQTGKGTVQAIIDSDAFRLQTPGIPLIRPRNTVNTIDTAIDNYHAAAQANKLIELGHLLTVINSYRNSKLADPNNPRLIAVNNLKTAVLLEQPLVERLDILATNGVVANLANIATAAALSDLELNTLSSLGLVNTIAQVVTLHNLPRANADIITLAGLPQINSYASLRQLSSSTRPENEISQLADLGGVGLGGHVLPAQPSYPELLNLTNGASSIVQYTNMLGSVVVGSAAELEEYGRTGRINRLIAGLIPSHAENDMYYIPMNLHYTVAVGQLNRTGWKAAYSSVYAIKGASEKLDNAVQSVPIRNRLIAHNILHGGAGVVPDFLADVLKANWLQTHTGAEGIHYQGGDRGDDLRAN